MKYLLFVVFASISALAPPSFALPTAPNVKPPPNIHSGILASETFLSLKRGLDAADSNQWSQVRSTYKSLSDPVAKKLLLWKITTNAASRASFSELTLALEELSNWPKTIEMQKQVESLINATGKSPEERITWFETYPPVTGVGKLEYAIALRETGHTSLLPELIKDIWRHSFLPSTTERKLISEFSHHLDRNDYTARVDMLLWTNQRSSAKRWISKLNTEDKRLSEARLALMEGRRGVNSLIDAVPARKQSNAGLLFERAKWRRRRASNMDGSIEALLEISPDGVSTVGLEKIWSEKRIALRTLIKEKRWKDAYQITSSNGLAEGIEFAEAEFYAGWIALRYLDAPQKAFEHFEKLSKGVSSPISLARGLYWKGEAERSLGETEAAIKSYSEAAKFNYVFYGQMAAERLKNLSESENDMSFSMIESPSQEVVSRFNANSVVQAAKLLAESGRLSSFERFSFHLDDMMSTPQEHQLLSDLASFYLEPRAGIRNGKSALYKGLITPDAAFPVVSLPESPRSGIAEPALVLALSRQESELTPTAISHADARGMMQLLPATGRNTARSSGLPYRTSWLTDDPTYNMKLGRSYLDGLIKRFDGSYILALAAYNAGPSRPARWIEEYGDPRKGEIDPIDFIESIPFSETRNYVQRILENTQVYRHRLSGKPTEITLLEDLHRGGVRP